MKKARRCRDTFPYSGPARVCGLVPGIRVLPTKSEWPGQVPTTSVGSANDEAGSETPRAENLDAELLLHGAPEAVLHLGAFVVRRRRALVIRLGLDAQADEIGTGRGDDFGHLAVKVVEVIDRDRTLEACTTGHHGVVGAVLVDHRHVFDGLVALVVDNEVLHVG